MLDSAAAIAAGPVSSRTREAITHYTLTVAAIAAGPVSSTLHRLLTQTNCEHAYSFLGPYINSGGDCGGTCVQHTAKDSRRGTWGSVPVKHGSCRKVGAVGVGWGGEGGAKAGWRSLRTEAGQLPNGGGRLVKEEKRKGSG